MFAACCTQKVREQAVPENCYCPRALVWLVFGFTLTEDRSSAATPQMIEKNGGREGIRTPGLLVANEALSQLSYSPTSSNKILANGTALANRTLCAVFT